jgi:hypothetical protein
MRGVLFAGVFALVLAVAHNATAQPSAPSHPPPDVVGAAGAAPSAEPAAKAQEAQREPLTTFKLEGYVNLGVGVRAVPKAVPRDQLGYGLRSSIAGLIVKGTPFERFSYVVHFGVNPEAIELVDDVGLVNKNGRGTDLAVETKRREVTLVPVEEVSISYAVTPWWNVKGGHFYMRFSPAASVLVTSQMFPSRPDPTRVFMVGADQGVSTTARFLDGRIEVAAGAFNGSSLELRVPGTSTLGLVYSALVDVQPLGRMPDTEGDPRRGPFRFGLGVGGIYRDGKLFERAGYEATRFREARLDVAARVAFSGIFVQGEYLRRQLRDELSSRPASATGAYAQASYFQPIPGTRVAVAPLARYGIAIEDEEFATRKAIELEAGIAFYPRADPDDPNKLRLIIQYDGEQRLPERETAHAGVLHVQLRWP